VLGSMSIKRDHYARELPVAAILAMQDPQKCPYCIVAMDRANGAYRVR
jgi:hypothetical protein